MNGASFLPALTVLVSILVSCSQPRSTRFSFPNFPSAILIPSMKHPKEYRRIHFVTGKLAEAALRRQVEALATQFSFEYSIDVLPISVAALLNVDWVLPRLTVPQQTELIVLPGYCQGELDRIQATVSCDVTRGPKDLRQLPTFFGNPAEPVVLNDYDVQILAEIDHAPQRSLQDITHTAQALAGQGADVIDLGCDPGHRWLQVGDAIQALKDLGLRVSIDSMNPLEIGDAVAAGAELVLSVNQENRHAAIDWGVEVVAIPDQPSNWNSLQETVAFLSEQKCPFRIDPILEPIGFGLAQSIQRYLLARQTWPAAEIMMGVGNLTELSDVDSAGVNFLLLGICQELGIRSVLTTQVINWARTSVRELDIARRILFYSVQQKIPPKRLSDQLIQLRDPQLFESDPQELEQLAVSITDPNYRIFQCQDDLYCMGSGQLWSGKDPFAVFQQMLDNQPANLDPSHAFYLGYEMCKAELAGRLGKNYQQDQALRWGHLTVEEPDRHRLSRRKRSERKKDSDPPS